MKKNSFFTAKKLAFCGIGLALAFVLSCIKLPFLDMPNGGSTTLFSMLFVCILGYFYGPVTGLLCGFVYSLLQIIQGVSMISVLQFLFDYTFAFTALGLSGFFHKAKHGLLIGYIAAITARFVFSTLSGIIFWSEITQMSDIWPAAAASALYNGEYIYAEGLATVIILSVPYVHKQIDKVKAAANH